MSNRRLTTGDNKRFDSPRGSSDRGHLVAEAEFVGVLTEVLSTLFSSREGARRGEDS